MDGMATCPKIHHGSCERSRRAGRRTWLTRTAATSQTCLCQEPIGGEWRDRLQEALAEADAALGGDSNDAEHDALYSVRETIASLLGVTSEPPSPYEEEAS
jgi:hypothetical protein